NKWSDVLRVKRKGQQTRAAGTFSFHTWIRDSIAADVPYDRFVRDIVTAIGDELNNPPTVWYKEVATPEQFVDDVSQVFLGPRAKFADWLTKPENPFFAKAVANRYWAHFFGRGIVDPLDDMRVTNPPSNPELLDALAKVVVDNKYSLKALIRTICTSRTYQLASTPNEFNKTDKQAYARYYPKRLQAEVLLDALCQATDSPSRFNGLPADKNAPN